MAAAGGAGARADGEDAVAETGRGRRGRDGAGGSPLRQLRFIAVCGDSYRE